MIVLIFSRGEVMEKLSAKLGARIKVMRRSRGYSQEKLAEKAVIDSKFLSQLELGTRSPSLGTVHKIAQGLGIPVKELFDFEHYSHGIRHELRELVETLNDETARKAYKIVKVLVE